MNLPAFQPKNWVLDVFRTYHPRDPESLLSRGRDKRKLVETFDFASKEEAEELATKKSKVFDAVTYEAITRPANPRDHARQRLDEIAEAAAKELEATLQAEERILSYDSYEFGSLDMKTPILTAMEDVLDHIVPEDQDPIQMGWLSSKGTP